MNGNFHKFFAFLIVASLSLLVFSCYSVKVEAQATRGVVTIAFDDGYQSQYSNAYPLMKARGFVGTFYIITDFIGEDYMSVAELQDLQANGNEIGSHSKSHPAFTGLTEQQIRDECLGSKQVLQSYGLTINNFAYPYGDRNDYTDSIASQYYRSIRSAYVEPFIISLPTSQVLLTGYQGETSDPSSWSQLNALQAAENEVNQVASNGGWVIIFFHNTIWGDYSDPYEIAAEYFRDFLDYVQASDVSVLTVNQALNIAGPSLSASISPTSVNMNPGGSQQFTSTVTGGVSPYTYQWYLNNSAVPGATNSTWTFNPTSTGTYKIYLQTSDSYTNSAQSNISTARVTLPLTAAISPTSLNMTIGATRQFTSALTGGLTPYTYQWYYTNNTAIVGATTSTLNYKANYTGTYTIYLNVTDNLNYRAKSNTATLNVYSQPSVTISPTKFILYYGQSQTFSSSTTGGLAPYTYQWYINNTAVPQATYPDWTFTPRRNGNYLVHLNVTDSLGSEVKSNIANEINVYSVYLMIDTQASYSSGEQVSLKVTVLNQQNPKLESTLALTITGPAGYSFYDFQPINVSVNAVDEYSFNWVVPNFDGTYIIEASLVPTQLTTYDAKWVEVGDLSSESKDYSTNNAVVSSNLVNSVLVVFALVGSQASSGVFGLQLLRHKGKILRKF